MQVPLWSVSPCGLLLSVSSYVLLPRVVLAELIAAVLQRGGLMSLNSNPGAATPESLHQLYSKRGAVTANPFLLRSAKAANLLTTSIKAEAQSTGAGVQSEAAIRSEQQALLIQRAIEGARTAKRIGNLHVVAARREAPAPNPVQAQLQITLHSLDMRQRH